MPTTTQLQVANSTTYADVVGLQLGLPRFQGETSTRYMARLYAATAKRRDLSYEGLQDELTLQLGLDQWVGIRVTSTNLQAIVTVGLGTVTVTLGLTSVLIPTVIMAADNYWEWRRLSDVVADLNQISGITAELAGPDGPALTLVRQSNLYTVVGEAVTSVETQLAHTNLVPDSLVFQQPSAEAFNLDPITGKLSLGAPPVSGQSVSYQYLVLPCLLVVSDVGLFSLQDAGLATVGVSSSNVLAYQLREVLQTIMQQDPSYWAA